MRRIRALPFVLLIVVWSTPTHAVVTDQPICPVAYNECLPLDFEEEYQLAHLRYPQSRVQSWELLALRVIQSGNIGKNWTDLLDQDCGAHGFAHLQPGNGILGPDFLPNRDCPVDDPIWRRQVEDMLYSPVGIAKQRLAWIDIVETVIYRARRDGVRDPHVLAALASMANSTPYWTLRWGQRHHWDLKLVIAEYLENGSEHRQRRVQAMCRLLDLPSIEDLCLHWGY